MNDKHQQSNLLKDLFEGDARPYWQSLGMFIENFSIAEFALFRALVAFSGTHDAVIKALLGQVRAETISGHIHSMWKVNPPTQEIVNEFNDVLNQMGHIRFARNLVAHNPSIMTSEDGRIVSDGMRVKFQESENKIRISPEFLDQMSEDLILIGIHGFSYSTYPGAVIQERAETWPQLKIKKPWQYKPQPNLGMSQQKQTRKGRNDNKEPQDPH